MSKIDSNTNQMLKRIKLSKKIRVNWLIDFAALLGFFLVTGSGIFFLVSPSSSELSDLHQAGFVLTIIMTVIHLARHWKWVKTMVGRSAISKFSKGGGLPKSSRLNVIIDALIAICFVVTVVSGVSLEHRSKNSSNFSKSSFGSLQSSVSGIGLFGNRHEMGIDIDIDIDDLIVDNATSPAFQWAVLDLTHLWAAIILLILLVIHLWLHRRWITNVTRRVLVSQNPRAGFS